MVNYWQKTLVRSEINQANTNEKGYVNIPKSAFYGSDKNPTEFYVKNQVDQVQKLGSHRTYR